MQNINLQVYIDELQQTAHKLLHLGEDTGFVYAEDLSRLNNRVHKLIHDLYNKKGKTIEQEASLCLAVLMGYAGSMYANPSDEKKKQQILNRCWVVLEKLPDSLLKCQLLIFCYGEIYERDLADAAYGIINTWDKSKLTRPEQETIDMLQLIKCAAEVEAGMYESR